MIPSLLAGAMANASGMHAVKAVASIKGERVRPVLPFLDFWALEGGALLKWSSGNACVCTRDLHHLQRLLMSSFLSSRKKKIKIKPQPKYSNTDILAIGEIDDGLG